MTDLNPDLRTLLARAEAVLQSLEALLPDPPPASRTTDFTSCTAFRWKKTPLTGKTALYPVHNPHPIRLADLCDIDTQKARIQANTQQFLAGKSANNVLLTGARGCGKSSLIKALLNEYAPAGLRLIEVDKTDLVDLPDIVDHLSPHPYRFVLYCDDLSFESGDASYKALKVALDGSIAAPPDNVIIYATSNRRHLLPEYMADNLATQKIGQEIHPGETIEEKTALSERFGLWISFYPFSQDHYLNIVKHWLHTLGIPSGNDAQLEREALNWALQRGSRSGRVAWQFAKAWAGQHT